MFGLFGSKKSSECPVDEQTRLWIEESMLWLLNEFGLEKIKEIQVLTPEFYDMPVDFNGQPESAIEVMKIIARQMDINADKVRIELYDETSDITKLDGFAYKDHTIEPQLEEINEGQYCGKDEQGMYNIGLRRIALQVSLDLVTTLAHEMAHVKLLGENRMDEDNQPLVDLATAIFGLGVFGANASLQVDTSHRRTRWRKLGYLSQMEWGYALALLSYIRQEEEPPHWAAYLNIGVKADMEQGLRYIYDNEDIIMKGNN